MAPDSPYPNVTSFPPSCSSDDSPVFPARNNYRESRDELQKDGGAYDVSSTILSPYPSTVCRRLSAPPFLPPLNGWSSSCIDSDMIPESADFNSLMKVRRDVLPPSPHAVESSSHQVNTVGALPVRQDQTYGELRRSHQPQPNNDTEHQRAQPPWTPPAPWRTAIYANHQISRQHRPVSQQICDRTTQRLQRNDLNQRPFPNGGIGLNGGGAQHQDEDEDDDYFSTYGMSSRMMMLALEDTALPFTSTARHSDGQSDNPNPSLRGGGCDRPIKYDRDELLRIREEAKESAREVDCFIGRISDIEDSVVTLVAPPSPRAYVKPLADCVLKPCRRRANESTKKPRRGQIHGSPTGRGRNMRQYESDESQANDQVPPPSRPEEESTHLPPFPSLLSMEASPEEQREPEELTAPLSPLDSGQVGPSTPAAEDTSLGNDEERHGQLSLNGSPDESSDVPRSIPLRSLRLSGHGPPLFPPPNKPLPTLPPAGTPTPFISPLNLGSPLEPISPSASSATVSLPSTPSPRPTTVPSHENGIQSFGERAGAEGRRLGNRPLFSPQPAAPQRFSQTPYPGIPEPQATYIEEARTEPWRFGSLPAPQHTFYANNNNGNTGGDAAVADRDDDGSPPRQQQQQQHPPHVDDEALDGRNERWCCCNGCWVSLKQLWRSFGEFVVRCVDICLEFARRSRAKSRAVICRIWTLFLVWLVITSMESERRLRRRFKRDRRQQRDVEVEREQVGGPSIPSQGDQGREEEEEEGRVQVQGQGLRGGAGGEENDEAPVGGDESEEGSWELTGRANESGEDVSIRAWPEANDIISLASSSAAMDTPTNSPNLPSRPPPTRSPPPFDNSGEEGMEDEQQEGYLHFRFNAWRVAMRWRLRRWRRGTVDFLNKVEHTLYAACCLHAPREWVVRKLLGLLRRAKERVRRWWSGIRRRRNRRDADAAGERGEMGPRIELELEERGIEHGLQQWLAEHHGQDEGQGQGQGQEQGQGQGQNQAQPESQEQGQATPVRRVHFE